MWTKPFIIIRVDRDVPHTARIWNYWLGGKDNFAADRAVGDQVQRFLPDIVTSARADRAFLGQALLSPLPSGTFPGVDDEEVYEFLERHSGT